MNRWTGSAAVCINPEGKVLMVLQGKPDEPKVWSIPSGGIHPGESYEDCCIREVLEETGYEVEILRPLHVKTGTTYGYDVEVHYFEVKAVGGTAKIQDPDGLIYEIAWKSQSDFDTIEFSFPEDKAFLILLLQSRQPKVINLFLDDLRRAPYGFALTRTIDECILLLETCTIHTLSLDYNLEAGGLRTGYDVARYIVDSGRWPKEIYLHTNDPVGRRRMYELLTKHKPGHVMVYDRRKQ